MYRLTVVYDEPADKEAFDRRYTDEWTLRDTLVFWLVCSVTGAQLGLLVTWAARSWGW